MSSVHLRKQILVLWLCGVNGAAAVWVKEDEDGYFLLSVSRCVQPADSISGDCAQTCRSPSR